MEEAASRQEEGEAGRLSIDHLCDTAFLELGPRGLGHHGAISGLQPRFSLRAVCLCSEAGVPCLWSPARPSPALPSPPSHLQPADPTPFP